jgi:hypothetical protein
MLTYFKQCDPKWPKVCQTPQDGLIPSLAMVLRDCGTSIKLDDQDTEINPGNLFDWLLKIDKPVLEAV